MPLEQRVIEAALTKKGFIASEGDHKFFAYFTAEGKKTSVWTKTSHGSGHKTITDGLVSLMARQCGLTNALFKRFVDCDLAREDYETNLIENGRIKVSPPKSSDEGRK
jgi:hypothetical protein